MSSWSRLGLVLVIAAAALMFLPGTSIVGAIHPSEAIVPATVTAPSSASAAPASAAPVNPGQAAVARLQAALTADHVP
ncbi:MAG: hypothetical protein WA688_09075, partial [Thermoplasmata archaeon]